ncbi:LamB/YcsF family protein [Alkalicoccus saliphilus]|jgi:5-oxoprolinase (ATP-hydrolysing) subunit A|uniref:5-oxoprolinase subunit A n=1 Tax=Alkalicoccus saliphilus TaxID=200989 RepID=A0A2T4U7K0_9BACI|nr:5-oxoprolinase subunit PxpA [Alkalicoccus saliphilus]PTL39376.1 LamB/YcsF family protein [Alkalicoccus saliphilus]
MKTDLNSDLGESFGAYVVGNEEGVLPHISSVNIACGYHAGDHNVMARTVELAVRYGVGIGAHPGYQDLIGFGRRHIDTSAEDIYHAVLYQIGALQAFCRVRGVPLQHVKPHGALFNKAAVDAGTAEAVARAVADTDRSLILYGLAGSELIHAGEKAGLVTAQEVFADRTYQADGTLTPRSEPNAIITNTSTAVARAVRMVTEGKVTAEDGRELAIQADTVCIHGDGDAAAEFARELRRALAEAGVEVAAPGMVKK